MRASILAAIGMLACTTQAGAASVTLGKPLEVFADPSDVVIALDTAGQCGSKYFHIQRSNVNFKEVTAAALTALSSGLGLRLFVNTCAGDRNILSHVGTYKLTN